LHAQIAVCNQLILSKFPILFIDRSMSAKADQYLDLLTHLIKRQHIYRIHNLECSTIVCGHDKLYGLSV